MSFRNQTVSSGPGVRLVPHHPPADLARIGVIHTRTVPDLDWSRRAVWIGIHHTSTLHRVIRYRCQVVLMSRLHRVEVTRTVEGRRGHFPTVIVVSEKNLIGPVTAILRGSGKPYLIQLVGAIRHQGTGILHLGDNLIAGQLRP